MCGIAGLVRFGGIRPEERRAVKTLPARLAHRGPDGEGFYADGICALAQTRLAVMGGGAAASGPFLSAGGRYRFVYNGEIYNYAELGKAASDTMAFFGLLAREGPQALVQCNGMYAFFLWDSEERRGWAAVDPIGIKPFLYSWDGERFLFCSEAGPLVDSGLLPFAPNPDGIAEYLAAPYFSSAHTLPIQGLERLPQGHVLELNSSGPVLHSHYLFRHGREAAPEKLAGALTAALDGAARDAMTADAPPGIFLSGGVDSGVLAAAAQRYVPVPMRSWTIDYEGQSDAGYADSLIVRSDDVPFAEAVANRFGLAHTTLKVPAAEYEFLLLRSLRTNDLIAAWEQEVSQNVLAEAARKAGLKAVLVGDAADETHFGYSFLLHPERVRSPGSILQYFGTVPVRRGVPGIGDFTHYYRTMAEQAGYRWDSVDDCRLAMSRIVMQFWLPRLLHNGDIQLMAHGIEGRVPFGDPRLLSLAQQVDPQMAYTDGIEKWHLRKAAETIVGPEIAWRPKSALTKNLAGRQVIHRNFASAWKRWGDYIAPFVDADSVSAMAAAPPESDRETGLRFRLLALMTWFHRMESRGEA